MAKIKKYQGDTGKSSVDPVSAMNAFLMQQAQDRNHGNKATDAESQYRENLELSRRQQRVAEDIIKAKRAKQENEQRRRLMDQAIYPYKKGGPVTALDQVDKMYKAKYKKK
jgi:hypothetical protein